MKLTKNIKPEFVDDRGEIFMLFDDGKTAIKSVLLITCTKGAIRANHYHKEDSHYCYMLTGSMEYTERPVGSSDPGETIVVSAGDLIYTPPMVEHAMHFLEPSSFLTLATKSRKEGAYEEDTVRVKLID